MSERVSAFLFPLIVLVSSVCALYAVALRPAYFSNSEGLATLLFIEVLVAAIWNYRARFFPLLLGAFLWAGLALPLCWRGPPGDGSSWRWVCWPG